MIDCNIIIMLNLKWLVPQISNVGGGGGIVLEHYYPILSAADDKSIGLAY